MISNASESFFSNVKSYSTYPQTQVTHPKDQISAFEQTSRRRGMFTHKFYMLFIHLIKKKKDWCLVTYP